MLIKEKLINVFNKEKSHFSPTPKLHKYTYGGYNAP